MSPVNAMIAAGTDCGVGFRDQDLSAAQMSDALICANYELIQAYPGLFVEVALGGARSRFLVNDRILGS